MPPQEHIKNSQKHKANSFTSPGTFQLQIQTPPSSKRRNSGGDQPDQIAPPQLLLNHSMSSIAVESHKNALAEVQSNRLSQSDMKMLLKDSHSTNIRENWNVQSPVSKGRNTGLSQASSKLNSGFDSTRSLESQTGRSSEFLLSPVKPQGRTPMAFSSSFDDFPDSSSLPSNFNNSSLSDEDSPPLPEEPSTQDFFRQTQNIIAQKVKALDLCFVPEFGQLQLQFALTLEHIGFAEESEWSEGVGKSMVDKGKSADLFSRLASFFLCSAKGRQNRSKDLSLFWYFANLKYDSLGQPERFRWFFSLLAMTANAYQLSIQNQTARAHKLQSQNFKIKKKSSLFSNFFETNKSDVSDSLENMDHVDGLLLVCLYRFIERHFEYLGRVVAFLGKMNIDLIELLIELKGEIGPLFNSKVRDSKFVQTGKVLDTFTRIFLTLSEELIHQLHVNQPNTVFSLLPRSVMSFFQNPHSWKTDKSSHSSSHLRAHIESQGF